MRRGAAPAPRRISLPARLRRSRAATQRPSGRTTPRAAVGLRRIVEAEHDVRALRHAQDRSRDAEAAAQRLRQLPAALRRAELQIARVRRQCLRRRGIGARHAQPRRARRSLCAARSPAVPSRGARWQQPPPRAVAAHPPGRSPARQSAHTGKTPAERPPASRRTVPASARRYAGSTPPADRRRGGCLRQGTARRPNASPARRSARPRRAIPLSQTWFPLSPLSHDTKRTLPTLWESPLFPCR